MAKAAKIYGDNYGHDDDDDDGGLYDGEDFMLALQLQMQMEGDDDDDDDVALWPVKKSTTEPNVSQQALKGPLAQERSSSSADLMDPHWELIDPSPDIRAMFQEFDNKYFWSSLGSCLVEWSKRMTICAGIFYLREGGIIRLSEPLLKYRPRHDLVQTLLHEMIHAYLYLTRNFKDRGEHGDEFKSHMRRINALANTNITVYHSFHDEVDYARKHVWRCSGPCRQWAPYHGYVKRSMNRAPGKTDTWWAQHQAKCAGTFAKVSEPDEYKAKQEAKLAKAEKSLLDKSTASTTQKQSKSQSSQMNLTTSSSSKQPKQPTATKKPPQPLANSSSQYVNKIDAYFTTTSTSSSQQTKSAHSSSHSQSPSLSTTSVKALLPKPKSEPLEVIVLDDDDEVKVRSSLPNNEEKCKQQQVECPICFQMVSEHQVNVHVNNHFNQ